MNSSSLKTESHQGSTGSPLASYVVYLMFFLSGAAALIYEISWSRQIGLLFGHTVQAASIVLASYFFGLALGCYFAGRWLRKWQLLGYAVAEIIVAGWAIVIPYVLAWAESSSGIPWIYSDSIEWKIFARSVFSFLLLLPATTAMGATLPLVVAWFEERSAHLTKQVPSSNTRIQSEVTWAYSVNTLGAFVGVLLTTFVLMIGTGVKGSSYVAAAVSVACGMMALLVRFLSNRAPERLERLQLTAPPLRRTQGRTQNAQSRLTKSFNWAAVFISVVSGFGILALQVAYTRMFSLVFHNSTYTFGLVVAVFLVSLSLGAGIVSWTKNRLRSTNLVTIVPWIGGALTLLSVPLFVSITGLNYFQSGTQFWTYVAGAFGLVSLVVGPPIVVLGMLLPLAWEKAVEATRDQVVKSSSETVGSLTAANTVSATCGPLVTSFVLLPSIGLWPTFVLIAGLFGLLGLLLTFRARRIVSFAGVVVCGLLALVVLRSETTSTRHPFGPETIVKRWDSSYGWIDVVQRTESGAFLIRQNLHYGFGTTNRNAREYRQAHIPLLLHDQPTDVLFMGLGTGLTAGGGVLHPEIQSLDIVELIPEVYEAAAMLADYNLDVLSNPKTKTFVEDGRHFLLANEKRYDVIVSDLFVPWESQSGYLYTVEHYQRALARLSDDGLFCQWLPVFQLGEGELESIADSFSKVFPETSVWWSSLKSNKPVIALVGSRRGIELDSEKLAQRLGQIAIKAGRKDPDISNVDKFVRHYLGDWRQTSGHSLNTDEFPRVEFLTPISNRNREMLSGKKMDSYYESSLKRLPKSEVWVDGIKVPEFLQAR